MRPRFGLWPAGFVFALAGLCPQPSAADQGGLGFWLPGAFASLAAAPGKTGWAFGSIYLHEAVNAGGDVAASRLIDFPGHSATLTIDLDAKISGNVDLLVLAPSYLFASPVLGGQFTASALLFAGNTRAHIDTTVDGALGPIGFSGAHSVSDSLASYGDVFPQATVKWNHGVHNTMVYAMMNLPIGDYDSKRIVNLGLGHWSIDAGAGYTYFNPASGNEFSAVTGFTYNFINPSLDYQNGVDWHLDWAASHFVSKTLHLGVAGYIYQQVSGDSGAGATFGDFKSSVFGVGPQIGYLFPAGGMQGYLNLRGYGEFGAVHRPQGWNLWLTLAVSPG